MVYYVEHYDGDPEAVLDAVSAVAEGWPKPVVASVLRADGRLPAAEIGGPVALKADFAPPAHASDIDAVLLGAKGEAAVRSCWRELERRVEAAGRGWIGAIVQCMVGSGGADLLLGAIADPDLGPVLAVGFGGRRAGLDGSAAFGLLPETDAEADELIDSAGGVATQLDGFRGSAVLDRQALRELMLRFALLLRELPEVVETDLNPVRCTTHGCVVLDMRMRIERRRPVERVKTW
jgi:acetate---CoA ligase (ADP-forming)